MKKRIFALVLTVLFIVAAVPVAGVGETPEGYDEHDYWKIRNFLEIADENNIKNGNKISENYSPYDPTTWTGTDSNGYSTECAWTTDGHLRSVYFQASDVVGELDVSGCTKLYTLAAYENRITGFDVSGCNELYILSLDNNQISEVNVRDLPALGRASFDYNLLTELELPNCPNIGLISAAGNRITSFDAQMYRGTQLYSLCLSYQDLSGTLDCHDIDTLFVLFAEGCSLDAIDLTGCTNLADFELKGNNLTELDLSDTSARSIQCGDNRLTSLILPENLDGIDSIFCQNNYLSELDISGCGNIWTLATSNNRLEQSHWRSERYGVDYNLMSEGSGYVGFFSDTIPYAGGVCYTNAVATPSEGAQFAGWYTPDGTLVSSEPEFELGIFNMANWAWFSECEQPELIARFVGGITLGDVNGDNSIGLEDAIIVLRYTMGLAALTDEQIERADFNSDGTVDALDAILILRHALGVSA